MLFTVQVWVSGLCQAWVYCCCSLVWEQHVARADRVCTHCRSIAVADDLHMIHECPFLQHLGDNMLLCLQTPTTYGDSFCTTGYRFHAGFHPLICIIILAS